ncbi:DUF3718 domain-containing protein [Alteromonas sediminis]|uniref:DUF3718 domain-containing protein n=1 Tax=Alteromonas sediminis TaxID=2259342 RepID=A0A3N5Y4Y6_9ALTE|nr:DUF3718 domain-containing protein [Alteromonas sediminis]RPJ68710.1 DUF3718 domain-containing protein [Alteromonas sediminis]
MKKLICRATFVFAMTVGVVSTPVKAGIGKQSEQLAGRLCENIKSSSKFDLRRMLKKYRLSVRIINNKLVCYGLTPIEFASKHNNKSTLGLLYNA